MSRNTTAVLNAAKKKLAAIEGRVAADRDKLRDIMDSLDELHENCEQAAHEIHRAIEAIDEAADYLSKTV